MNFLALDFTSQATSNKLALANNPELSEKYKFLIELSNACKLKKVNWALSCSALLFFKGIWAEFHDFDIIVKPNDFDKMVELLITDLGFKEEPIYSDQSIHTSLAFRRFSRNKIEVELICEWGIIGGGNSSYKYCFKESHIETLKISDTLIVPLLPLEAQFILYRMLSWYQPERMIKVKLLYFYLKEKVEHSDVFDDALTQALPNTIRVEIKALL